MPIIQTGEPKEAKKARKVRGIAKKVKNQAVAVRVDGKEGYFSAQMHSNKRDVAGFATDDQPGVSQAQLLWLTERLSCESDAEACEEAHYDSQIIKHWKMEPEFRAVYDAAMANKREAFKYLVTQALPAVLRRLLMDLDDSNGRTRMAAATLLLRTNGMLVDKVQRTDPDAVVRLMELMRQTAPVRPLLMEPRP